MDLNFFNGAQPIRARYGKAMRFASAGAFLFAASVSVPAVAVTEDTGNTGNGTSFSITQPSLSLTYFVPLSGQYPSRGPGGTNPGVHTLGSVRMFGGTFAPGFSTTASGQELPISQHTFLFSLLGTTYGGDGRTDFGLPGLNGRAVVGAGNGPGLSNWNEGQIGGSSDAQLTVGQMPSHNHAMPQPVGNTSNTGGGQPLSLTQPSQALNYVIATDGFIPGRTNGTGDGTFLGQVGLFAGTFAPEGWQIADGSLLAIQDNQDLFSILGTTYGGDGRTTFALPNLQGRVPVHPGDGVRLGSSFGSEEMTLSIANLPSHNHAVIDEDPTGNAGGSQDFSLYQPSLGLNHIIALEGEFPSRDGGISGQTLIGEVTQFAGNFAPDGWAFADGRLMELSDSSTHALFSILGTTYGGDGRTTFALPDLRGRTAVNADGSAWRLGQERGAATTTLATANLPEHHHTFDNTGLRPDNPILPEVADDGSFMFDINVDAGEQVWLDPLVAVGYDFEILSGAGMFESVEVMALPGDDLFTLLYDDGGMQQSIMLLAGVQHFFSSPVSMFRIEGIDLNQMLDPLDLTAFVWAATFTASGQHQVSQTPITQFVGGGSAVPEPITAALGMLSLGALGMATRRRVV